MGQQVLNYEVLTRVIFISEHGVHLSSAWGGGHIQHGFDNVSFMVYHSSMARLFCFKIQHEKSKWSDDELTGLFDNNITRLSNTLHLFSKYVRVCYVQYNDTATTCSYLLTCQIICCGYDYPWETTDSWSLPISRQRQGCFVCSHQHQTHWLVYAPCIRDPPSKRMTLLEHL